MEAAKVEGALVKEKIQETMAIMPQTLNIFLVIFFIFFKLYLYISIYYENSKLRITIILKHIIHMPTMAYIFILFYKFHLFDDIIIA